MILRTSLILACFVVGAYSLGGMLKPPEFKTFEQNCFQNNPTDPFKINGQENPLANSLENFLSLAEKLEVANPNLPLKDELFYFLRHYNYENIKLTTQGIVRWKVDGTTFSEIDTLWEQDVAGQTNRVHLNEPFSDDEECSLYYMISHSIVDIPDDISKMRSMSNDRNDSSMRTYRTDINQDDYYPQEIGVVAIRGSEEAVSLSRVLAGMYAGLNQNRKQDIMDFPRIKNELKQEKVPVNTIVDSLYSLTLAEVLMLSTWAMSNRKGLSEDGTWVSYPLDIKDFCPTVYKPKNAVPAYSYATVRGAADGLILGTVVDSIEKKKQTAKLSQILRMYYSREGIVVETDSSNYFQLPSNNVISFCNRKETVDMFSGDLDAQMELYGLLASEAWDYEKSFENARGFYKERKDLIYTIDNKELDDYCQQKISPESTDDLSKETLLDVIVVMDTSVSDVSFKTQQLITGHLASYMDLRHTGSRMTIFLDQRISTDSSSVKIELKPVVLDEYSSSCAACSVGQVTYEKSSVERDQIVHAIDQLLEDRKNNETKYSGVNGKVVVFFNFESDGRDNNKIQGRLDKALRDFFTRNQDVNVYAVGVESDTLKKFARNDPASIFLSSDGSEKEVAQKLFKKISSDPSLLQYSDCTDGTGESSAIYENFVSPYAIQHLEMPPKYFYKSHNLKFTFESQNGVVKVCHNRATSHPENEAKFCNLTTNNNRVEFRLSNPCKSLTKETCSPFYFSVIGQGPNGDTNGGRQRDYCNDLTDKWCDKLDSIKFKVSHEGVRCNGCLGIAALPLMTLFTVLISYLLHKMF